jgi:hypothetical protein
MTPVPVKAHHKRKTAIGKIARKARVIGRLRWRGFSTIGRTSPIGAGIAPGASPE